MIHPISIILYRYKYRIGHVDQYTALIYTLNCMSMCLNWFNSSSGNVRKCTGSYWNTWQTTTGSRCKENLYKR